MKKRVRKTKRRVVKIKKRVRKMKLYPLFALFKPIKRFFTM